MTAREREDVCATLAPDIVRRLDIFVGLLTRWQAKINLVAPSTMAALWTRHIADSLQVQAAVPAARRWVDVGSGGGFPGLVTAIVLADESTAQIDLVESDRRKATFLRTVSRETGAPAAVHAMRIEAFLKAFVTPRPLAVEAVSARALAPLATLVRYAEPFLLDGAVGVFPKGQQVQAELTELARDHRFALDLVPSRTDPAARLVLVRAAGRPRGTHGV